MFHVELGPKSPVSIELVAGIQCPDKLFVKQSEEHKLVCLALIFR